MARKFRKRAAASPEQLAASVPSPVALAALLRSGAGKHGKSGRSRARQQRQAERRRLRGGDWD